jgi:hypothetical protein
MNGGFLLVYVEKMMFTVPYLKLPLIVEKCCIFVGKVNGWEVCGSEAIV